MAGFVKVVHTSRNPFIYLIGSSAIDLYMPVRPRELFLLGVGDDCVVKHPARMARRPGQIRFIALALVTAARVVYSPRGGSIG